MTALLQCLILFDLPVHNVWGQCSNGELLLIAQDRADQGDHSDRDDEWPPMVERMRERWPDVKVLCVSGYTDGVLPEVVDGKAEGLHFLAKRFRRRELALKVREALDARIPATAETEG